MSLQSDYHAAMNRLTKWRTIFVGWQLGTRLKGDPESDALRDHREATIIMRAELSALTKLLIDKKVIGLDEWIREMTEEAEKLDLDYARRFPGIRATDYGIEIYDPQKAVNTMKGWRP